MWDDERKQSISADLPEQKECIEMGGSEGGFVLLGFVRDTLSQIGSVQFTTVQNRFFSFFMRAYRNLSRNCCIFQ